MRWRSGKEGCSSGHLFNIPQLSRLPHPICTDRAKTSQMGPQAVLPVQDPSGWGSICLRRRDQAWNPTATFGLGCETRACYFLGCFA